jgi:hypothetical protein
MKTTFTLLLATVITTSAFAYDEGKLTITVAAQKDAVVYVDGRSYTDDDNSVVLNNIRSGNHTIKVYKKKNNNRNNRNQREELLYSSTIYVRPSYHVDVVVNRFGKALVDERALNNRDNNWDDDEDNWGGNNGNGNNGNGNNGNGYRQAMSDYDFNILHQRIKSAWFSGSKMTQAKEAFDANYFSTSQVRQVLQLFNSDSDKLELAKLAYRNTVDQRSYRQLYDVFSFQSTKDDLDRFIREFRY